MVTRAGKQERCCTEPEAQLLLQPCSTPGKRRKQDGQQALAVQQCSDAVNCCGVSGSYVQLQNAAMPREDGNGSTGMQSM